MLKVWRYIWISVVALVGLLLLTVLLIPQLDPNRFKGIIETQVSELAGRQLNIDGDLHIDYTLPPLIRIENVRFANAEWAKQPSMLSLELLQLKVQLLPLLDKQLIVDQIMLKGVYFTLEKNPQGQQKWQQ